MTTATVLQSGAVTVVDYRCDLGPGDRSCPESHRSYSLAYVRRGGFACHARGRAHDLVAGSFMVGYPGDEYRCSHEHHARGDECLSFQFSPEFVDELGGSAAPWREGGVPPVAELMVLGGLAQAIA